MRRFQVSLISATLTLPPVFAFAQQFPEVRKADLGGAAEVFEFQKGEAQVNIAGLKRIEIGKEQALFTVRNETNGILNPAFAIELFNRYGMKLCGLAVDFRENSVSPGEVRVKEVPIILPDLAAIFVDAPIKLPADWREIRFARVKPFGLRAGLPQMIQGGVQSAPRPRPQIVRQQRVRPAIFEENKFGTANIGNIAVDAKWSNYGAYLQRMIEAVQQHWDAEVEKSRIYPGGGSFVRIKFVLDDEGKIARIVDVENHSSDQGARMCATGVTAGAPYGPWTDDMKAGLGHQQEMAFTFYYK